MKSSWWAVFQYEWCPYKKGDLDTDIHGGESPMKMEAETRVMLLTERNAKDCRQATRSEERHGTSSSSPQKEPNLLAPCSRTSRAERVNCCCLGLLVCDTLLWCS